VRRRRGARWLFACAAAVIAILIVAFGLRKPPTDARDASPRTPDSVAPVAKETPAPAGSLPSESESPTAGQDGPSSPIRPVRTLLPPSRVAHLTGQLLRGDAPAPGVEIRLLRWGGDGVVPGVGEAWSPIVTDVGGCFETDVLPGGEYTIEAALAHERIDKPPPLHPREGQVYAVRLELVSALWIEGSVRNARGLPPRTGTVHLYCDAPPAESGAAGKREEFMTFVDGRGQFEIVAPREGSCTLVARDDDSYPSEPVVVTLTPDAPHRELSLRLRQPSFIRGQLRRSDGQPFAGELLTACSEVGAWTWPETSGESTEPARVEAGYPLAAVSTDEDGRFELGPLDPQSTYAIVPIKRGTAPLAQSLAADAADVILTLVERPPR